MLPHVINRSRGMPQTKPPYSAFSAPLSCPSLPSRPLQGRIPRGSWGSGRPFGSQLLKRKWYHFFKKCIKLANLGGKL